MKDIKDTEPEIPMKTTNAKNTAPKTPLKDALNAYCKKAPMRGHMPGHKGKITVCAQHDVTELYCTDDLYCACGPIALLEAALAKGAHSRRSLILTDGSSAGVRIILCTLAACLAKGERLLMSRAVHKSASDGCVFAGLNPDFAAPDSLLSVLENAPDGYYGAVFLTSPDYFGAIADLHALSRLCRKKNIILAVDEAHGAHLPYLDLPGLPCASALADISVQSMHKTMGALTQAALLNINRAELISPALRFRRALCTSSPSYLIMESMESAACCYPDKAPQWLSRVLALRRSLKNSGISLYEPALFDPTRLCILTPPGRGGEISQSLTAAGFVPELADPNAVVFILTPYDDDYAPLAVALRALPLASPAAAPSVLPALPPPERALDMRRAAFAPCACLPANKSAGHISAVCAGAYPPGLPCVFPGEIISPECADFLSECAERGASFGMENGCIAVLD